MLRNAHHVARIPGKQQHVSVLGGITESQNGRGWKGPLWVI